LEDVISYAPKEGRNSDNPRENPRHKLTSALKYAKDKAELKWDEIFKMVKGAWDAIIQRHKSDATQRKELIAKLTTDYNFEEKSLKKLSLEDLQKTLEETEACGEVELEEEDLESEAELADVDAQDEELVETKITPTRKAAVPTATKRR